MKAIAAVLSLMVTMVTISLFMTCCRCPDPCVPQLDEKGAAQVMVMPDSGGSFLDATYYLDLIISAESMPTTKLQSSIRGNSAGFDIQDFPTGRPLLFEANIYDTTNTLVYYGSAEYSLVEDSVVLVMLYVHRVSNILIDLADLRLRDNEIDGWIDDTTLGNEYRIMTAENLSELLNGGAEQYVEHGLVQASRQRMVKAYGQEMELFSMDFGTERKARTMFNLKTARRDEMIPLMYGTDENGLTEEVIAFADTSLVYAGMNVYAYFNTMYLEFTLSGFYNDIGACLSLARNLTQLFQVKIVGNTAVWFQIQDNEIPGFTQHVFTPIHSCGGLYAYMNGGADEYCEGGLKTAMIQELDSASCAMSLMVVDFDTETAAATFFNRKYGRISVEDTMHLSYPSTRVIGDWSCSLQGLCFYGYSGQHYFECTIDNEKSKNITQKELAEKLFAIWFAR